ncbi:176_t:CDS:2 [Paraglomus occultum]|uniref:176_t:CDS:1 n=1 Tax=Paraglomus occultum TaxID=144539 RepID=A0A9N8ZK73_9GLOM|nr:176_t:CDS:2 [Paraglomus occultum]
MSTFTTPNLAEKDIRVVVGIDFGTTFSGFALANKANPGIIETHETWPDRKGHLKTNTALQYDEKWNVTKWGAPALASRPKRKKNSAAAVETKPVELFKLHLGEIEHSKKPPLPIGLDFRKAITDYLRQLSKLIKDTLKTRWPGLEFDRHVLKVMTVPAEYNEKARYTLRTCAYEAGLIDTMNSEHLEFTPEPEAAAIYCIKVLKEHSLQKENSFLIVDCGGGTVDLTVRILKENNKLTELTERTGDFCGGSYVDKEFLKYLEKQIGSAAMRMLEEKHYAQLQYLVQEFCAIVKLEFDGNNGFGTKEIDLEEVCPVLKQYVTGDMRDSMEEQEWMIQLDHNTVKGFFDPVVEKIITLIENQLSAAKNNISAMFMVGGFSESKYLFKRVKQKFDARVPIIAIPSDPIAAVVRGAVLYGMNMATIETRVLKRTYGLRLATRWKKGDPIERKTETGRIKYFKRIVKRGTEVPVDASFFQGVHPSYPEQTEMDFHIYTTPNEDGKYCDDDEMEHFGSMTIVS